MVGKFVKLCVKLAFVWKQLRLRIIESAMLNYIHTHILLYINTSAELPNSVMKVCVFIY